MPHPLVRNAVVKINLKVGLVKDISRIARMAHKARHNLAA
jgi:hypothetical protein